MFCPGDNEGIYVADFTFWHKKPVLCSLCFVQCSWESKIGEKPKYNKDRYTIYFFLFQDHTVSYIAVSRGKQHLYNMGENYRIIGNVKWGSYMWVILQKGGLEGWSSLKDPLKHI